MLSLTVMVAVTSIFFIPTLPIFEPVNKAVPKVATQGKRNGKLADVERFA
jgi:hypothetical protein